MSTTMKALLSRAAGGPDSLRVERIAIPSPGPDEVLIRVHACGINYPDLLVIEDKYQGRPPRPFAPGGEVSGAVVAVGDHVSAFKPGDRVIALTGIGGMAEMVVTPAVKCALMPDGMPFDDAAAFIGTYGTSYHALKQRGRMRAGESLLVLGAAGGVGLAAVQLGRAMGARVIAAASSQEKVALAKSHGAADGFVYPAQVDDADAKALAGLVKSAVGPDGVDIVYDAIGGPYAEAALRSLAWRGRFLVVGFPAGIPKIPLNLTLLKGCEIVGVFYGSFVAQEPECNDRNIAELFDLYRAGKIRPHISARFPLADAATGLKMLADRTALGKVIVLIE